MKFKLFVLLCEGKDDDNDDVYDSIHSYYNIGRARSGDKAVWTWLGAHCYHEACTWYDGSGWDYDNWGDGQPNSSGYVIMTADHWSDSGYSDWYNTDALCKK